MSAFLKRAPIILGIILPTGLVLLLLHMISSLDLSMQAPYRLTDDQKKTSMYLVSFADGKDVFLKNRNILAASAINRGIDFIYNYRKEHIDPEFLKQNPILNEQYGAGYWLWKPYFILKTLNSIPEGSILVYADSGLLVRQPVRCYFEKGLSEPGKDILLFAYNPKVYGLASKIASGDTFDAIHCREDRCRYGHHVWAGILVLRNSPKSRAFIKTWLGLCQNEQLLKGVTFKSQNFPEFSHHQHDEGILSALAARESDKVAFFKKDCKEFESYIHFHRRKEDRKTLVGYVAHNFSHLQKRLLNFGPIQWLTGFSHFLFDRKSGVKE